MNEQSKSNSERMLDALWEARAHCAAALRAMERASAAPGHCSRAARLASVRDELDPLAGAIARGRC